MWGVFLSGGRGFSGVWLFGAHAQGSTVRFGVQNWGIGSCWGLEKPLKLNASPKLSMHLPWYPFGQKIDSPVFLAGFRALIKVNCAFKRHPVPLVLADSAAQAKS